MINRTGTTAPAKWLLSQNLLHGDIVHFGEGRAFADTAAFAKVGNVQAYDPNSPIENDVYPQPGDICVAIYVLNTLLPVPRRAVFREIRQLAPISYIALRTDSVNGKPLADGVQTSRNTFQKRYTAASAIREFGGKIIYKNSWFLIMEIS
jgi:hypothetical protein